MKRYAVSLAITKQSRPSGQTSLKSAIGIWMAHSKEEALGLCVQQLQDYYPGYFVASFVVVEVDD